MQAKTLLGATTSEARHTMKRLELLDYGRFIAACFVILYHYTFNGIANGKVTSIAHTPELIAITKYGYLGVELFFMISGYVIFYSAANRTASQFAVSRAQRLFPCYWFAILFTTVFAFFWGGDEMSVSLMQVIVNFTMVQHYLGFANVDGVYWTLLLEITFYGAIFFLLLFGFQRSLEKIFVAWPWVMCLALVGGIDDKPLLGGYYYYFAAGSLFALINQKTSKVALASLLLTLILCMTFSSGKAVALTEIKQVYHSPYIIGAIIFSFFGFFALFYVESIRQLKLPGSTTLGALTYPVYLIHAHFGYMFINRFATESNKFLICALAVSFVLMVAYFMHKVIEQRLAAFWKAVFSVSVGRPIRTLEALPKTVQLIYFRTVQRFNR